MKPYYDEDGNHNKHRRLSVLCYNNGINKLTPARAGNTPGVLAINAEMASPANRSKLPNFRQSLNSAKDFFAVETSAKALNAVTLRANGELWLVEVKRSGAWRKLWNFGQLSF